MAIKDTKEDSKNAPKLNSAPLVNKGVFNKPEMSNNVLPKCLHYATHECEVYEGSKATMGLCRFCWARESSGNPCPNQTIDWL
ncbi:hypothetical protein LIA77_08377 [Sarocladium implicatum]|nr:hypothetical protein LIA77_08377 [Sarocladium implicatum]